MATFDWFPITIRSAQEVKFVMTKAYLYRVCKCISTATVLCPFVRLSVRHESMYVSHFNVGRRKQSRYI